VVAWAWSFLFQFAPAIHFFFFWQPEKNLFIAGENFCCCDKVAQKYYLNIFLGKNQRQ